MFGMFAVSAVAVSLLAGCQMTSALYPPFEEKDIDPAANAQLAGFWEGSVSGGHRTVRVEIKPRDEGKALDIRAEITGEEPDSSFRPLFPLIGAVAKIGERRVFCVFPDLDAVVRAHGYDGLSGQLAAGRFYLFDIAQDADSLTVKSVSFGTWEKDKNEFKLLDPSLQLAGTIVVSPTAELRAALAKNQVELKDFAVLKRKAK